MTAKEKNALNKLGLFVISFSLNATVGYALLQTFGWGLAACIIVAMFCVSTQE